MGSISVLHEYNYPVNFAMDFYTQYFGASNIPASYRSRVYYNNSKIAGILSAIQTLPEDYQRVIEMRCNRLMSFKEIASTLGRPQSSVQYTYSACMNILAKNRDAKVLMLYGKDGLEKVSK